MKYLMSIIMLFVCFSCDGCGEPSLNKPVAKVKGKVTFNGQPVTSGMITTVIQGDSKNAYDKGKSATAEIQSDGSFQLTTYEPFDGAVVGNHKITVSENDPSKKLPGKSPPDLSFEVKANTNNELNIELLP